MGEEHEHQPTEERVPDSGGLEALREAARGCTGCDLYLNATQTVFGVGGEGSRVMLVGEQPGDREDLTGEPFVGPAGRLLDAALQAAGIDRRTAYVTNAVKHFKWRRGGVGGKRRLHEKPNQMEISACRPWLDAEIARVGPELIVCLGATAAQALLGKAFRVTRDRGNFFRSDLGHWVMATIHPSAILRSDDRDAEMAGLIQDLKQVPVHLERLVSAGRRD